MIKGRRYRMLFFLLIVVISVQAQKKIIVDANGKGDFKTIQEAINSLTATDEKPRTIFIRKGIYKEKLFIEIANIIFEGENREQTIINEAIS